MVLLPQDTHTQPPETGAVPSRHKKRKQAANERTLICANDDPEPLVKLQPSSSDLRRSRRITAVELIKREKTLLKNELDYKRRAVELDERALQLMKKENEASLVLSQIAEREAVASLSQLEEHFTCAFPLVITPDGTPRLDTTFPFVPNRTVAAVCESLIEKLRCAPSSTLVVKREDSEGGWGSGWASCSRKKEVSKDAGEKVDENADIAGWREGGFTRTEWLKRER
ncbi:hypothetical protein C0992_001597 [Termitomyces sp. T32_za158]|nr:hypothetical protein C0992_001597 [Termitomyces sp. T32_za158]